ncbi:interferon-induced protein 44-like [Acanthochromis polyacanthus]|uniref:interferon-induced protein 44-like n=1 Tax=Acanthochromis polyacanthus TaxID=80966 RepID=UPI0022349EB0|nr:interferon-induced protein 44-like [Acanthochromis polyacanthus]
MGGGWLSKPWRDLPKNSEENLGFLKSYQPRNTDVKHLRILVHGPIGAGKSSFINSVNSVLQNRITCRAPADAVTGGSVTDKYTTYKISKDPEGSYSFVLNDTMGFEKRDGRGVHVEDIKLALKGHVKEGYKFKPEEPLTEGDFYNPSPTLDDRVHVLVSVVPADKISEMTGEDVKKMREVRQTASEMGIPQLAIITNIDRECPKVRGNIKYAYWSKVLMEWVEKCSFLLGMPPNCIFLVKNYHSETKTSDDIDALILVALREMVSVGEDFLNDLQD